MCATQPKIPAQKRNLQPASQQTTPPSPPPLQICPLVWALACSQGPDPLLSCPAYGSIPQGMQCTGQDWPSLICCDVVSVALSPHLAPFSPPSDHIQGRLIMALVPPWLCLSTGRSFKRTSSQHTLRSSDLKLCMPFGLKGNRRENCKLA